MTHYQPCIYYFYLFIYLFIYLFMYWFFFFFFLGGGGGGIDIGIGDVTLVRMFKSLIWMTHYFSSKLNVLGIS